VGEVKGQGSGDPSELERVDWHERNEKDTDGECKETNRSNWFRVLLFSSEL
jgi:hypothetical protein